MSGRDSDSKGNCTAWVLWLRAPGCWSQLGPPGLIWHLQPFAIPSTFANGITGAERTAREEKGAGCFSLEREAGGESKAAWAFQSLCSSSPLRRMCIICSHRLSFPRLLRVGLRQKRAVPGACSTGFGCLLHLISREGQSLSYTCCFCLLHAICFSCSLSIQAQLAATTENH